jgi:UDP-N-acetylmuramate dehydrogenase
MSDARGANPADMYGVNQMQSVSDVPITSDAKIPTWFGLGGTAKRLAKPRTIDELRACVELDAKLKVLGDGANLLIADQGVSELVVSLSEGEFGTFEIGPVDQRGYADVRAGAGVHLFKLINATVQAGLSGLENLAGIPASVGGATMMNAGGKYGSTGDYIKTVHAMDRTGAMHEFPRTKIEFVYRHCSLATKNVIVTSVTFRLKRAADPAALKAKLKEVTEYKKTTQPLNANSAGCCFKNPTLTIDVKDIGTTGTRISAGMLIDRAGCKGLSVGGAEVSQQHANFIVAKPGCKAGDVIEVMRQVRQRVHASFGVMLDPEVVLWGATL